MFTGNKTLMKKISLLLFAMALSPIGLAQVPCNRFLSSPSPVVDGGVPRANATVDSIRSLEPYIRKRVLQTQQRYRMEQLRQGPSWQLIQTLRPHYKNDITYIEIYHNPQRPDVVFFIAYLEKTGTKQVQIEAIALIQQGLIRLDQEECPLPKTAFGFGSIKPRPTQAGQAFNRIRQHVYHTMIHVYGFAEEDIVRQNINRPLTVSW